MTEFDENFLPGALEIIKESEGVLDQLGAVALSYASRAAETGVPAEEKEAYEQIAPALRHLIHTVSRHADEIEGQDIPVVAPAEPFGPEQATLPEPNVRMRRLLDKLGSAPVGEQFRARHAGIDPSTLAAKKNEINRYLRAEQPPLVLLEWDEDMPGGGKGMYMLGELTSPTAE